MLEKITPMNSEDNDVNDATAALKGMLGISSGPSSTTADNPASRSTPKNSKQQKKGKGKQKGNSRNSNRETKGNNDSRPNSTTKGRGKNDKKENFAWSAFQASPDASALPIPAFKSPNDSQRATSDLASSLDSEKLSSILSRMQVSTSPSAPVTPVALANAPRAEDLEAEAIAAAERATAERGAAQAATEERRVAETPIETDRTEKMSENMITPVKVQESSLEQSESASGINLAALASSPPVSALPPPTELAPPTPAHLTQTPFSSPNQFPSPFRSPPHHQAQHPYLPPSPGYVTIQVQVPPILGPDRRMVVASPAGYPVQILVPEEVPPGMVIPVHVPAGPMMHPGQFGGYPNMPFQQHHNHQHQHQQYQQYQEQQHQQQQYQQQQQRHHGRK